MVEEFWKNIELQGVNGILLDLDNTLYEYEPCHSAAYNACKSYILSNFKINDSEFDQAWSQSRKQINESLHGQAASHSRLLYAQKFVEKIFGQTKAELVLRLEEIYWDTFLMKMDWFPGAENFLQLAVSKNIKICLLTDLTAQIQLKKWNRMGLEKYIQFMVSSEEAGIEKPASKMFEIALNKLNLQAEEVIMIGDSLSKDIEGAIQMKIKYYHLTN